MCLNYCLSLVFSLAICSDLCYRKCSECSFDDINIYFSFDEPYFMYYMRIWEKLKSETVLSL